MLQPWPQSQNSVTWSINVSVLEIHSTVVGKGHWGLSVANLATDSPETRDLLFQHCHPLLQRDRCSMRPSTRFNGNAPERSDNTRCMPVVATLRQQGATAMLVHATSQQRCHSIAIMGNVVPLHMQGATWTALSALSAMHLLQLL